MEGRICSQVFVAALLCAAASFATLAASGDTATPADQAKQADQTKPAGKAKTAKPPASPPGSPAAGAASASKSSPGNDLTSPVAYIGDRSITLQDLALNLAQKMMGQWEFDQKKQALDDLINDRLLEKEAAAKGVPKEKLIDTEVTSKIPDPAQSEIDAWYEQNKARVGTQTKDQLTPQIKAMLRSQKLADVQKTYTATLRQKYNVKIVMKPTRYEVSLDDDAFKGPEKAPVTIVEFSDYQCPYCGRAEQTVSEVLKKYGDKIHFVYRDYPLPPNMHPNAETAAEASECARDQGKFWEMHDAMFSNQSKLAAADLVETAGTLGMDKDKFKACLDSGKKKDEVQRDYQDGQKYSVTGTPTFFINGMKLVGARDVNSFSEIIDQELQEKQGKK